MRGRQDLEDALRRIDRRPYPAYRDLKGRWAFEGFALSLDHVQGDPFASPSRLSVEVPLAEAGIPGDLVSNRARRIGTQDALIRTFARALERASGGRRGSGKSGQMRVDVGGQAILERSACRIEDGALTMRFYVGLPAQGRRILGREAAELLCGDVPRAVAASLLKGGIDLEEARRFAECVEDAQALRDQLATYDLVAFVATGSILPRRSGADDRPLTGEGVLSWAGPEGMAITLETPNGGAVRGTGIPRGVTLICGGGYHGKSTLLSALSAGIYDHIPGDGRERVVTSPGAVKIRAEDGRRVCGVDISPFINGLPQGRDTARFFTEDASGSTSQAAAIIEALEVGADCLLIDEDTSATNFMIRDRRMQALVSKDMEPITPFVDRIREIYGGAGVSAILVIGGSGDYLDVADRVLVMEHFTPRDATVEARAVAAANPTGRSRESEGAFAFQGVRVPLPEGFDARRGRRERVRADRTRGIQFGTEEIDLTAVEQLVDPSQTRTIGDALLFAAGGILDGRRDLKAVVTALEGILAEEGPGGVMAEPYGDRAAVRGLEIAQAINRLRSLTLGE